MDNRDDDLDKKSTDPKDVDDSVMDNALDSQTDTDGVQPDSVDASASAKADKLLNADNDDADSPQQDQESNKETMHVNKTSYTDLTMQCVDEILYDDKTHIIKTPVVGEMKKSFIAYAMAVNVSRAIPDVRDGLKPVHRRILYSMSELNLFNDKPYRKCARIVGDVLGKYHPHGDSAVYDALVRLAQDFTMRVPLVDGHGNFGSVDGDPPAAQRYTEARLAKISAEMLRDIDKDSVDFYPNFDDTLQQPTVLPSRFPNLLVNGADGIAVGMATAIPPHNLGEVIDGVIALINNPDIEVDELMTYIKAPDYPTGGIIMGKMGIRQAYKTGHGKVVVRAKTEIEEDGDKARIIITEIPYQVNKANLIIQMANLVKDKRIEGISDIKEESDRQGMRIVVDIKRDANPQVVLNLLFKHSQLQVSYGINFLALVDSEPKVLNLKQMLYYYLEHQKQIIYRRSVYDLERAKERAHIVEGLVKALADIDEVVRIIKTSKEKNDAIHRLCEHLILTEIQAQAILDMRLARLTALEVDKLKTELMELHALIAELESIIASPQKIVAIVAKELLEIKQKYNEPRRTELSIDMGSINILDLIPRESTVVTLTGQGYIKRMSLSEYHTQNRGGVGITTHKSKENDAIQRMFVANTHDTMLFFTNRGRVFSLNTYEIPEGSRVGKGRAIINLLQFEQGERATAVIPIPYYIMQKVQSKSVVDATLDNDDSTDNIDAVSEDTAKLEQESERMNAENPNGYLMMVTKNGLIKKTPVTEFFYIMRSGKRAITLEEGDELIEVVHTTGTDDILIASSEGKCIRFNERHIRVMGRAARGVRAMRLPDGARLVDMSVVMPDAEVLTVTSNGYGKRSDIHEYRLQSRGGIGIKAGVFNDKTGELIGLRQVQHNDDILLITNNGLTIRITTDSVRKIKRAGLGVKMMRLRSNNKIVSFAIVPAEQNIDAMVMNQEDAEALKKVEGVLFADDISQPKDFATEIDKIDEHMDTNDALVTEELDLSNDTELDEALDNDSTDI